MALSIKRAVLMLVAVHASYSAPNSTKRSDEQAIIFPGPLKLDIPDSCRDATYCTVKPRDYPDDVVRELFKNRKQVPGPELELVDLGNRQGDPDIIDDCQSIVSYEPIYRLKNGNTWQTVLQAPQWAYEQKVRLERCMHENGSCFTGAGTFGPGVRTLCKQKFATWKLQVIGEDNKPILKEVELPSCCSCHYEIVTK